IHNHCISIASFHAVLLIYFFFSSRRRHTRFSRDWSSDVCSSDLLLGEIRVQAGDLLRIGDEGLVSRFGELGLGLEHLVERLHAQIGRASCRERVEISGGGGSREKKR